MKQTPSAKPKFAGALKHHHLQKVAHQRVDWEEWAEANPGRRRHHWGKIILIIFSLLVLAGIITGLAIELAPA